MFGFDRRRHDRPSLARRLAAGAWHVIAGFAFLARNPPLWPLAVLPAILAFVLLTAGFFAGLFAIPRVEAALLPGPGEMTVELGFAVTLALWAGMLAGGMVAGLAAATLLSAPVLEQISRQVERRVRGEVIERGRGLRWELANSFRGAAALTAAAPLVFLLGLVPLVGPALGAVLAGLALAFQSTDPALARRGLNFELRRRWLRRWWREGLGFGLGGLVALLVPFANVLVTPALAAGATLLVLELGEGVELPEGPGALAGTDERAP